MRSIQKTMLMAGLAAAAVAFASLSGVARAQALEDESAAPAPVDPRPDAGPVVEGTLNAQYASLAAAARMEAGPQAPSPQRRPPGPPAVGLAHRLIDEAGAYAGYMSAAAAIPPSFDNPDAISRALHAGAGYEAGQLEEGAVAYAAIVALQDPLFVQGVRDWADRAAEEAGPVERLYANPSEVLASPGAAAAAAAASAALRAQGQAVFAAGAAVKQAAYAVQHQSWSKLPVPDAQARLAEIKTQSTVPFRPSEADVERLVKSAVAFRRGAAESAIDPDGPLAPPTSTVTRALAVAALAVLGAAGEENTQRLTPLLSEPKTTDCVKMSKLNLFQCMAVAGPHYEDVFCLGQHALMDTGQCVVKAAGAAPVSRAPAPTLVAQASPEPAAARSVMIPVAFMGAAAER